MKNNKIFMEIFKKTIASREAAVPDNSLPVIPSADKLVQRYCP